MKSQNPNSLIETKTQTGIPGAAALLSRVLSNSWRRITPLCFLLLVFAFCLRTSAQSYSIDWWTIDGGGGTSTNGQYTLSGTIAQPDAGATMIGGNFSLAGGFWSFLNALQTPGAPSLSIRQVGSTVTVYWENVSGWILQQNSNLSLPAAWSPSFGVTTSNGTNYLQLGSPVGTMLFRLKQE